MTYPSWATTIGLALALLVVLLLPLNLLAGRPFHHDEALYATWALQIVSGRDPWLAQTPIDKPPLFIYTLAGVMGLLGVTVTIARLPSLLATVLVVGLTFGLGRKLYDEGTGLLAAWLVALSPFTLLFAPTALTDPLLVALVLASCLAAVHRRPAWAGLALGLALATKQQALFFTPLALALLVRGDGGQKTAIRTCKVPDLSAAGAEVCPGNLPYLARFLLGLALAVLPLLAWNLNRSRAPGLLEQSLANYGGLLGDLAGFNRRWAGFVDLLWYATGSPGLNAIFLAGWPLLLLADGWPVSSRWIGWRYGAPEALRIAYPARSAHPISFRLSAFPLLHPDWLLTLFVLLFLLGHALLSFQVWDRYLLGLIPLLALLLARIVRLPWRLVGAAWLDFHPSRQRWAGRLAVAVLLALTMARPVQDAVSGRYPLGSNSGALAGIDQIVAYLRGHVGANNTLYHHWLGTHWRFYLWGYPYDLQYWASPEDLAARAKPGHLIAFPSWQSDTEARLALAAAGLSLHELTRAYHPAGYPSIILYRIERFRPASP